MNLIKEDIVNLLKGQKSVREISKIYNVPTYTIQNFLKRNKLKAIDFKVKKTDINLSKEQLINYLEEGLNFTEIGKIYNVPYSIIQRIAYSFNIKSNEYNKFRYKKYKIDLKQLEDDLVTMTLSDASKKYNYSVGKLSILCKENSIKFNHKSPQIKIKKTCIKRYGVDSYSKTREFQKKFKNTCIKRYGVEHTSQLPEVKQKRVQTLINNTGKPYSTNAKKYVEDDVFIEYVKTHKGITIDKLQEKFNYTCHTSICNKIREFDLEQYIDKKVSRNNVYWQKLILERFNVFFKTEGKIFNDKRAIDLFNNEYKVAIDVNPTATHNTQWSPFGEYAIKSVNYHRQRALDAEKLGWRLIQIFDWYNEEQILKIIKYALNLETRKIYARKCIVKEIDKGICKSFLDREHLQGSDAIGSVRLGLYYNDELVQVATFGLERWKEIKNKNVKNTWELIRLASSCSVIGGAGKLISYFIKNYNPTYIKSFSDMSTGTGKVYEKLGFKFERYSYPNAFYSNIRSSEAYKVGTVSRKFGKTYRKLNLSQKEYMNSIGFYRINDAGHKIYKLEIN